ncbi:MAG: class C sortase [Eubacteriaceae bacterium]|jgi:sortase A
MKKQAKNRIYSFLIGLMITAGVLLLLYPLYTNYMYAKYAREAQEQYQASNEQTDEASKQAQLERAREYNASLTTTVLSDPFGGSSDSDDSAIYYDTLNISTVDNIEGVMGFIEIPKIDVNLPVFHGVSDQVLYNGAGHMIGSSLPIGGNGTHAVLTGHTGIPDRKLFTDLTKLETGDEFFITVLGDKMAYQVDSIQVIEPDDISWFSIDPDKDQVTLITCTPYGINDHRLLVTGHRVPYTEESENVSKAIDWYQAAVFVILVLLVLYGIWRWVKKRKQRMSSEKKNR